MLGNTSSLTELEWRIAYPTWQTVCSTFWIEYPLRRSRSRRRCSRKLAFRGSKSAYSNTRGLKKILRSQSSLARRGHRSGRHPSWANLRRPDSPLRTLFTSFRTSRPTFPSVSRRCQKCCSGKLKSRLVASSRCPRLITSDRSTVAESRMGLQIPHRQGVFYSLNCPSLQGITCGLGAN
jgi:hypothetical protein